jgi:PAS domain S-box-containing protein
VAGGVCLLLAATALGAPPKRVLIVHSFVNAAPPFTTHSTAFETELTSKLGEPIDLDEVTLDEARYSDPKMQESLVEFMQKRQTEWKPDLVVPIGSPAGVFVAQYRDRIFREIPVLYCGMDRRRLPADALARNAAFVGEDFNLPGFVQDILQIAPGTTNIAVVIGASQVEQYWKSAFERAFEGFTNRVHFEWLDKLSFDQMLDRVSRLPPHSFIFEILLIRDASGVTHNADEALQQIHAVANAPVNGIFQHQLGLGIVGGRLYQAEVEGIDAAQIAIRILKGEAPAHFPPQIVGPLPPRYDARELSRWHIDERRLPPGSRVLFRRPTFWDRYRLWIVAVVTVVAAQALLITGLLVNRVRRQRAERTLTENRNRLRAILDTAVDGIITIDKDGIIASANPAAEKIFGYTTAELVGKPAGALVPSDFLELNDRSRAGDEPAARAAVTGSGREFKARRKDGAEFPVDLSVSQFDSDQRRMRAVFVRDITDRKQAERVTREFGGRLLRAQEAERARLGRELHDDITQRLARLAIDAGRVEAGTSGAGRGKIMREVREGLVRLSEDVHDLSYKLHPALLEDLGLTAALRAECERFTRQETIAVETAIAATLPETPPDAGLCLFRIAQEALRNVARHARAKSVSLALRELRGGLQLAVTDNGLGFALNQTAQKPSLGLASMRERVRLLGGELEIDSVPGRGTTILAWVPVPGKET